MTDLTDYAEEQFINWSFFSTSPDAAPTTLYVALHTGDPNNTGDNTEPANQNEVDDTSTNYQRAPVTADSTEWTMDTSSQVATVVSNDNEISFGTADSSWGTVSHFSIWTDQVGGTGDPLWASDLDASKTVEQNDEIRFDAGSLTAEIN